jgi:hypothetical protein
VKIAKVEKGRIWGRKSVEQVRKESERKEGRLEGYWW